MITNLSHPLTPDSDDHPNPISLLGLTLFLFITSQAITLDVRTEPRLTTPPGMLPPPINGIGYRHSHQHCGPGCPGYVKPGGSSR